MRIPRRAKFRDELGVDPGARMRNFRRGFSRTIRDLTLTRCAGRARALPSRPR